jgi:hypothetical protein
MAVSRSRDEDQQHQTRIRCLAVAEPSLAAAERLGHINRACQQKDSRIYIQRGREALHAVASIDQLTAPAPRRNYPEAEPRAAGPGCAPISVSRPCSRW